MMTRHDERPPALAGISLRTWVMVVLGTILLWSALGYAVLR